MAPPSVVEGVTYVTRGRVWQGIWDWLHPGQRRSGEPHPPTTREMHSARPAVRHAELGEAGETAEPAENAEPMLSGTRTEAADAPVGPIRPIPGTAHALRLLEGGAQSSMARDSLDCAAPDASGAGEAVLSDRLTVLADERELLDFLAADLDPVPVDPVFRERLREDLWQMVSQNAAASRDEP